MIVRTYTRRVRCSDGVVDGASPSGSTSRSTFEMEDTPFSQDSTTSLGPYSFAPPPLAIAPIVISSQDSIFSSIDSDPYGISGLEFSDSLGEEKYKKPLKCGKNKKVVNFEKAASVSGASTSTLMEAQEFGEMMEHVDEVNFALDGLRKGQPPRIRRASLLSLLSICSTSQQRRLLRAQGLAKRIVNTVLSLSFDDSPSTTAASALLYVLASDIQDDHLLDSPSCVEFLIKLLNPPISGTTQGKATTFGTRFLGIQKNSTGILSSLPARTDSSSAAIYSKVQNILTSSNEIKKCCGDDDGRENPQLSSKWIALLTIEKACLSAVSFDDKSGRRVGGYFKEKLRECGGLDAIFNLAVTCHNNLERQLEHGPPLVSELNDGLALQSALLLLKCLKVMENATFLSSDNQNYLLKANSKLDNGLTLSCVGLIISTIKTFSGLSLLQNSTGDSCSPRNQMLNVLNENLDILPVRSSEIQLKKKIREDCNTNSLSSSGECCLIQDMSSDKRSEACHKRQRLFSSKPGILDTTSERECTSSVVCSMHKKRDYNEHDLYNKKNCVIGGLSLNRDQSKLSPMKYSNKWISINVNGSKSSKLGGPGLDKPVVNDREINLNPALPKKRFLDSEENKDDFVEDGYDPFAFDEDDLGPSKWEVRVTNKKNPQILRSRKQERKLKDKFEDVLTIKNSDVTKEGHCISNEDLDTSTVHKSSDLLHECLLAAVKVLMNLTNDNPVGCRQIAACGGLETMALLITSHFPSFNISSHVCIKTKDLSFPEQPCLSSTPENNYLKDHELDFLVSILGLLVNLVERDSENRSKLVSASVPVMRSGRLKSKESCKDVIQLLCSIFLANQGAGDSSKQIGLSTTDEEAVLLQGEREAEMMIVEAYSALLLAFLSTDSRSARKAISCCLPDDNLRILVPVLERFVDFHLSLSMISPETHSIVSEVIESCRIP